MENVLAPVVQLCFQRHVEVLIMVFTTCFALMSHLYFGHHGYHNIITRKETNVVCNIWSDKICHQNFLACEIREKLGSLLIL